ncbi:MAG: RDD family protein [Nakamurella sp.]
MGRQPWNRLAAFGIDWLCMLAWIGVSAVVGVPLFLGGVTGQSNPVVLNLVAFFVVVAPITVALAALESGKREATFGKRARRLIVVLIEGDASLSFARALLRNTVKIAIPWALGHALVYGIASSGNQDSVPAWVVVIGGAAYALPLLYVIALFVRTGRTPYDWIAGTRVISLSQPR